MIRLPVSRNLSNVRSIRRCPMILDVTSQLAPVAWAALALLVISVLAIVGVRR